MQKEELVTALKEVLHEHRQIDDEKHHLHHQFIDMEIDRREKRVEAFNKFKTSFIGGLGLAFLGFLGWLGKVILEGLHMGGPQ